MSELIISQYVKKKKLSGRLNYLVDKLSRYHQPDIGRGDEILGWAFRPNAEENLTTSDFAVKYKINSKGLRDEEYSYDKKDGIYRILALGESHTFGEGINFGNRYTEKIEKALNNVEVINMGVWGFGIDQALLYLEKEGFKYNSDLITLFINSVGVERCGLFWSGTYKPRFELDNSGKGLVLRYTLPQKRILDKRNSFDSRNLNQASNTNKLYEKSSLFKMIKFLFYKSKVKEELRQRDSLYWRNINKNLSESAKSSLNEEQSNMTTGLILDRYVFGCKQHNARFLIVNIDTQPLSLIRKYCRQKNISYLDLSGILSNASKIQNLRFDIDPHYNDFAHSLIGEYVAEYVSNTYQLRKNKDFIYALFGKI